MTNDNQDALRCAEAVERMDTFTDYQRAELKKSADHLRRLVRENEAKDALLRQAVEALRWPGHGADPHADLVNAIRQHLDQKTT